MTETVGRERAEREQRGRERGREREREEGSREREREGAEREQRERERGSRERERGRERERANNPHFLVVWFPNLALFCSLDNSVILPTAALTTQIQPTLLKQPNNQNV